MHTSVDLIRTPQCVLFCVKYQGMSECVKVMVRVRPMNKSEHDRKCRNIIDTDEKTNQIILLKLDEPDNNKNFSYDAIFPISSAQNTIYETTAFNLIQSVVQGYNGTIFAYGQTGCGKTHTMMGSPDSPQLKGIIPRTFSHIMNIIQSTKEKKFLVQCSFLEIYNEEIHDLLSKDIKEKKEIKESPDKGVYVKDLSRNTVKNVEEMDKYLNLGFKSRAVAATLMNSVSSRSHSIFTIFLESEEQGPVDTLYLAGKLNLVDLAGSERQSKTQAEGDRLKEATKINLSLSALGNVISALVDGKSKHIPYRDSKLTRLLQDSLGGNTKTIMIANVSPADYNYDQTLSTLRYASRAKFIQNKPTINEDPKDALLKEYAEEIKRLKEMLQNGGVPQMSMGNGQGNNMMAIMAQGIMSEAQNIEKQNYENLLKNKEEELERHKLEKQSILQKLKSMEGQVVQGGTKENTVEAKKYKDLKAKIKKHKQEQQKLMEQAAKAEQQLGNITESYKSVQEQNAQLRQKLALLNAKFKQSKKEIKDLEHQHEFQKEELLENIRLGQRQSKFFAAIVKKIISNEQIEIIRASSEWNDQIGDYNIVPFLLKEKKVTFPKLAQRDVEDLQEQDIQSRQLITYQNDPRRKGRGGGWDEIINGSPPKQAQHPRLQKNPSKNGKYMRDSNQYLNMMKQQPVAIKSNRNVMLAPLSQQTIEANMIADKLGGTTKLELKRNKMLDPLIK